jgi:hypothetical protein
MVMASARRQGVGATPIGSFPAEPSPEAQAAMTVFADVVGAELRDGLKRGLPFATMKGDQVVWVHPDGKVRIAADPSSPEA